jgi:hypothetical protein
MSAERPRSPRAPVTRLAYSTTEAAAALGVSPDYFKEHVATYLSFERPVEGGIQNPPPLLHEAPANPGVSLWGPGWPVIPPGYRSSYRSEADARRSLRHRLLRQPGGFEGLGPVGIHLHSGDQAVAKGPELGDAHLQLGAAVLGLRVLAGNGDHPIPGVEDLFELERPVFEALEPVREPLVGFASDQPSGVPPLRLIRLRQSSSSVASCRASCAARRAWRSEIPWRYAIEVQSSPSARAAAIERLRSRRCAADDFATVTGMSPEYVLTGCAPRFQGALPNPLPTEAKRRPEGRRIPLCSAMGREGLEPSTLGLRGPCSTN